MPQRAFSNLNLFLLAFSSFCYFGQVGVLIPYMGIFLDARGFSSDEIGQLSAFITLFVFLSLLLSTVLLSEPEIHREIEHLTTSIWHKSKRELLFFGGLKSEVQQST